jgi:hypothetical protein
MEKGIEQKIDGGSTMRNTATKPQKAVHPSAEKMHALYRKGGEARQMAPHIVYSVETCPYDGCPQRMQAIDFRLEAYGPAIHEPLVRAWWADIGFAGKCPQCGGWIHFTIRSKKAISAEAAAALPQLPEDWAETALIL